MGFYLRGVADDRNSKRHGLNQYQYIITIYIKTSIQNMEAFT